MITGQRAKIRTYEEVISVIRRETTDENRLSVVCKLIEGDETCVAFCYVLKALPPQKTLNLLYFLREGGHLHRPVDVEGLSEETRRRAENGAKLKLIPVLVAVGSTSAYAGFLEGLRENPDVAVALLPPRYNTK